MYFTIFTALVVLICNVRVFASIDCALVNTSRVLNTDPTKLRIVQYNVEWLFTDYYSPADCPGNGCTWKTQYDAKTHLNYVARAINNLNPDIVNLCEVEGCNELSQVIDELDKSSNFVPYLKQGTDTSTGQNAGMITRIDPLIDLTRSDEIVGYPIEGSTCGYESSPGTTGVSKHYITEFNINNLSVAFIGAHLVAIPTDLERCAKREAQALILQNVIYNYIQNGFEIIMLGDFNDFDGQILDANTNIPISSTLEILKGKNMSNNGDSNYNDKYVLYNSAELIDVSVRYTDWWDADNNCDTTSIAEYSMIDHILVTPNIFDMIDDVFIYQEYDEYCDKLDSDHYPVGIDLNIYR